MEEKKLTYAAINLAPIFHQGLLIFADCPSKDEEELAFAHAVISQVAGNLQMIAHVFLTHKINNYKDFLSMPLVSRTAFDKIATNVLETATKMYQNAYGTTYPSIDLDYIWNAFTFVDNLALDKKNTIAFEDPVKFQFDMLNAKAIGALGSGPTLSEEQLLKMLKHLLSEIKTMSPERKANVKQFTERLIEIIKSSGYSIAEEGKAQLQQLLDALDIKASLDFNEPKQDFEDQKLQNLIKKLLD